MITWHLDPVTGYAVGKSLTPLTAGGVTKIDHLSGRYHAGAVICTQISIGKDQHRTRWNAANPEHLAILNVLAVQAEITINDAAGNVARINQGRNKRRQLQQTITQAVQHNQTIPRHRWETALAEYQKDLPITFS